MGGRRGGVQWVHLAVLLAIGLVHVGGMGTAEAYVMVPCAESPVFAAAGDRGRGLCYALKASMLGAPLAGELVLLCILLPLLATARAGLYDRILGTVAGWHAVGLAGAALLFALNTPVATSSLVLAGCSILPPPAAAEKAPGGPAGRPHGAACPPAATPRRSAASSAVTGRLRHGAAFPPAPTLCCLKRCPK